MSWVRSHVPVVIVASVAAALACGVALLYSSANQRRDAAQQATSPATIGVSAPAPDYELTPSLDTSNPLESTDAVRTIRETYAASAWANLTNNNDFAQYRLYVARLNSPVAGGGAPGDRVSSYPVSIGPIPFTPASVTDSGDGRFVVSICVKSDMQVYYPSDGSIGSSGLASVHQETFEVSPLTETERFELAAYDPSANLLRIRYTDATLPRVDCSTIPVVTQTFAHWKECFSE